jgi:hypothetical protein
MLSFQNEKKEGFLFVHMYDCSKVLCTSWQIITNIQYKCEVSVVIWLWHMENYQQNNKKIADVYKWMLKTNNEYKMDQ